MSRNWFTLLSFFCCFCFFFSFRITFRPCYSQIITLSRLSSLEILHLSPVMFLSVSHLGMIIFGVFNFREKKKANLYVIASLYEWNEEISGVLNNLSSRILSGLGIKWTEMNGVHYAYESVVLSFISFISELRRFTEQTLNRHCLVSVSLSTNRDFYVTKGRKQSI